jgi:cytoskeletal protein CcmA (bactofilin family)
MTKLHSPWVRLALILALTFVAVFGVVRTVWAAEIIEGDTIPSGEVIEDDVIISGEDVVVDGTVDGDMLAFGNTVTINGSVSGSLIAVGQEVFINGEVGGTVYSAGVRLELGADAAASRNLYFGGFRIVTEAGSSVGRDLNTVAVGAQFAGQVGRDLNALIGIVELIDKIRDAVSSEASAISGASPAAGLIKSAGLLQVSNETVRIGPGVASLTETEANLDRLAKPAQASVDTEKVANWLADRFVELVLLFIVGGLALWLIPTQFEGWADAAYHRVLPSAGYGLMTYIIGYAGAILLAVLLLFGGLALGIGVAWEAALSVWALGYSSLTLAFVVFLLFVSYVSKAILAYLGGKLILDRVAPRLPGIKVLALLLGILLYVLIVALPTLGTVIAFLVTVIGLGAVWVAWLDGRRRRREEKAYEKFQAEMGLLPAGLEGDGVVAVAVVADADDHLKDALELGRQQAENDIQARVKDLGEKNGPWSYNEALGSAASAPFDRALLAVTGILGASREQNVYYFAAEDNNGKALRADTVYKISGNDLPARWWSITAYDPLYLIRNEQNKYSINKTQLSVEPNGSWEALLTAQPRDDANWIHTGGGDTDLLLALRLYNPSPEVLEDMGSVELPAITPFFEEAAEPAEDIGVVVVEAVETEAAKATEDVEEAEAGESGDNGAETDAETEGDETDE